MKEMFLFFSIFLIVVTFQSFTTVHLLMNVVLSKRFSDVTRNSELSAKHVHVSRCQHPGSSKIDCHTKGKAERYVTNMT